MTMALRAGILCVAGALLGIAGNRFTPRPAPLGSRIVPAAKPLCIACTAVFVDARSPQEYAAGHVTGALHLAPGEPVEPLLASLRAAPTVIVYDRDRQCASANAVAADLLGRGLRDVRVLIGSWPDWLAQGGPGESGNCALCT